MPCLFGIPSHCCDSAASPLLQSPHLTAAWRSLQALDAMSFEHSVLALERAISYSEPVPWLRARLGVLQGPRARLARRLALPRRQRQPALCCRMGSVPIGRSSATMRNPSGLRARGCRHRPARAVPQQRPHSRHARLGARPFTPDLPSVCTRTPSRPTRGRHNQLPCAHWHHRCSD